MPEANQIVVKAVFTVPTTISATGVTPTYAQVMALLEAYAASQGWTVTK